MKDKCPGHWLWRLAKPFVNCLSTYRVVLKSDFFVGFFLIDVVFRSGIAITYVALQQSFALTLLTMGLIASTGGSMAYNAILTTAQRWFPDSVGLAGGIIVAGYGCGAFILSPLQTTFINPLNYRVNSDGFYTQEDLLQKVPQVFIVMALLFALLQIVGLPFVGQPLEEPDVETAILIIDRSQKSISTQLKSPLFCVLFISLTCCAIWVQLISALYKAYGQLFIYNDLFLSFVGSMASIFNSCGRVIWGVIADRTSYQFPMAIVCTIGASLVWLLPAVQISSNQVAFLISVSHFS
ncbi:hypothetical protein DICVIV_09641 [Dictyocaulus viviparus]|uniref:Oxalate:formate antiporter n=1 Tax=Dictyocaulus viviparus TaxID=29172 RepID=A0A0D8XI49_DICVI|nr:hypothetical protein DICVIV_09641 [Dictyocaulus viviparus]